MVTRYYDIDEANARIPDLRDVLEALREQRADLIRLRDTMVERIDVLQSATSPSGPAELSADAIGNDATVRRIRLRMQGVVDQMQAGVVRLEDWGVTLRDIESGLIDFQALVNGRPVCLCWRLGEDDVGWWHELDAGFGGRRTLAELE